MDKYKKLLVWQKSIILVKEVYKITSNFPKTEIYGIVSQMRRASISIPSNIAEGSIRKKLDYKRFLNISLGSAAELDTQIKISFELEFLQETERNLLEQLNLEVIRMLNGLINSF